MTTLRWLLSETPAPLKPTLITFVLSKIHVAAKVLAAIASGLTAHREYRTLVMQGVAERDAAAEAISRNR